MSNWLTASWVKGATPFSVALAIANSPEHEGVVVRSDYASYLGRSGAAGEINGWVNAFLGGLSNESIVDALVASTEYFQKNS